MNLSAREESGVTTPSVENEAAIKAVGAWINALGRTLKTCRLYDAANPTVIRFRDELARSLRALLQEHGEVTLRFTNDDVLFRDASLYPARSRDDNLALPFYRDGIRSMTFRPGIEPTELFAVLDGVLQVSGQSFGHDDLVTLLWEAQLVHVDIDVVPGESDIGSGPGESGEDKDLVPWPMGSEAPAEEDGAVTSVTDDAPEAGAPGRSDDWTVGDLTVEIEAGYAELESLAPEEQRRFIAEFEAEHGVGPVTTALAIVRACLSAQPNDTDRAELGAFIPRLLRTSVSRGAWLEAREALELIKLSNPEEWSLDSFAQELLQPISISTTVEHIDKQTVEETIEFVALARGLGEQGVEWLMQVLAESQQRRNRRLLAETLAEMCRSNPERLAPWLTDRRWYVVRNVVHILGWIGGPAIIGLLQTASRHPEQRVRVEVIAALGNVDVKSARPVLIRLLDRADTRTFCAVLHQLSADRNAATARLLLGYLQNPDFDERPLEERRAVYSSLGAAGGDDIVADLEAELLKGNWFSRNAETHRQSVARCIARIGTPQARAVLERGLLSRRPPVRKACEEALGGGLGRD